jgi:predicted RNA-binding protein YlxR (DUF448 family)
LTDDVKNRDLAEARRARKAERSQRTCVGCGKVDEIDAMVRLVIGDEPEPAVAVDLAGGQFGRGAHVHAVPQCLATAERGLSKSFRRPIKVAGSQLATYIVAAADRRVSGLLASACRSQHVAIGGEMAGAAYANGRVHLLVVARDAAAAASLGPVMHAVAEGGAVAWGTKEELGSLVGKSEVAVLGIVSQHIAAAVRSAVMLAGGVADSGGTKRGDQPRGGTATEVR